MHLYARLPPTPTAPREALEAAASRQSPVRTPSLRGDGRRPRLRLRDLTCRSDEAGEGRGSGGGAGGGADGAGGGGGGGGLPLDVCQQNYPLGKLRLVMTFCNKQGKKKINKNKRQRARVGRKRSQNKDARLIPASAAAFDGWRREQISSLSQESNRGREAR